jgi:hypothetical protein
VLRIEYNNCQKYKKTAPLFLSIECLGYILKDIYIIFCGPGIAYANEL